MCKVRVAAFTSLLTMLCVHGVQTLLSLCVVICKWLSVGTRELRCGPCVSSVGSAQIMGSGLDDRCLLFVSPHWLLRRGSALPDRVSPCVALAILELTG